MPLKYSLRLQAPMFPPQRRPACVMDEVIFICLHVAPHDYCQMLYLVWLYKGFVNVCTRVSAIGFMQLRCWPTPSLRVVFTDDKLGSSKNYVQKYLTEWNAPFIWDVYLRHRLESHPDSSLWISLGNISSWIFLTYCLIKRVDHQKALVHTTRLVKGQNSLWGEQYTTCSPLMFKFLIVKSDKFISKRNIVFKVQKYRCMCTQDCVYSMDI